MLHFHSVTGMRDDQMLQFISGLWPRHVLVSFAYPNKLEIIAENCGRFILDNGAFTFYNKSKKAVGEVFTGLDVEAYKAWVFEWCRCPSLEFCIIPDVIGGSEQENLDLIRSWPKALASVSAPVWHMGDHLGLLGLYARSFRNVCIAPNGGKEYENMKGKAFWSRMDEAMAQCCDKKGRPICRLHGLRMMAPEVFRHIPFSSADSTNAVQNRNTPERFGMYYSPIEFLRAMGIASRIEKYSSAPRWIGPPKKKESTLPLFASTEEQQVVALAERWPSKEFALSETYIAPSGLKVNIERKVA